jgi:hypothetical protein
MLSCGGGGGGGCFLLSVTTVLAAGRATTLEGSSKKKRKTNEQYNHHKENVSSYIVPIYLNMSPCIISIEDKCIFSVLLDNGGNVFSPTTFLMGRTKFLRC